MHGGNGSTIKATSVLAMLHWAMLHWLGVRPSHSRPRVSDDTAFVEALFRTAKDRPEFPTKGFETLADARQRAAHVVNWYTVNHQHSAIRSVSPAQRHEAEDRSILARRHSLYLQARERTPQRWSRHTRTWTPIEAVALNPARDAAVTMAALQAPENTASAA